MLGIPIVNQHKVLPLFWIKIENTWIYTNYICRSFFFKNQLLIWSYDMKRQRNLFEGFLPSSQHIGLRFRYHMHLFHFGIIPSFNGKKKLNKKGVIYRIQSGQKSLIFLKKVFELCARNMRRPRSKKHQRSCWQGRPLWSTWKLAFFGGWIY